MSQPPPPPDPHQADPPQADPPQADPPRADPPRADPPRAGPPQADPPQADPDQTNTSPSTQPGEVVTAPGFDDRERRLAAAAVTSWRVSAGLSLILPVIVLSVLGFVLLDTWGWAVLAAEAVLALVVIGWLQPARYRRWRWQLTDRALELRHGVVVHQQETVPYFRIQQIDIVQGPLDRVLDLASLQVTTASASGSATLPGLVADEAPQVRSELLARATHAVADHPGDLRDAV